MHLLSYITAVAAVLVNAIQQSLGEHARPLGVGLLLSGWDYGNSVKPALYFLEPSGMQYHIIRSIS
jgi:20S proteasome alpha/beta subunit